MKFKIAAFALLFVILGAVSIYSILMYQQVLAQDAQEGQLLSQVKVTRLEYDSGGFQCNITYNNPTNSPVHLSSIRVESGSAAGLYLDTVLLNSGDSIVSVELSPKLPNGTSPVFHIKADISLGISGRILSSAVQGSKIENYLIGRTTWNPTYDLLSYYSTLAAIVWIVGLGPAFVVMLFVSKSKQQVERWAAGIFAVNAFSVFAAFVLQYLPKPAPSVYSNYIPPGAGSFFAMIFLYSIFLLGLILGGGLNLYAIVSLLRHSPGAKKRFYLAALFVIVPGLYLSFVLVFRDFDVFWVSIVLVLVNVITLLRLRQITNHQTPNG